MTVSDTSVLADTLAAISPADAEARAAAEERQGQLTKPPGSLGLLEVLGNQLAGIAGCCPPPVPAPALLGVFAADHGVQAQAVSPWPQEVTGQMAATIAAGNAACNVLARNAGADVWLVDVGMLAPLPVPGIRDRRVRAGTADMTAGPAMSPAEALAALEVGIAVAGEAAAEGYRVLLTGEVGIGNTTAAAALISVFAGAEPATVTGRGAGASDAMLAHKISVIERALAVNADHLDDPLSTLAAVGGLEHAALTGFILGAASARLPVVLDGVIACSAALAATALAPDARDYLIAGHNGAEAGIAVALRALGLPPLVELGLRLGEGSGALTALPTVRASALLLREMATFASAGVSSEAPQ